MLQMNFKQKLRSKYSIYIFIDLFMMGVLIINLSLILFDWVFSISLVNQFLLDRVPSFYEVYFRYIHTNFELIDLAFVVFFLAEFIFSWVLAITQKVYYRWFFYPFLHWYDLLGCIPIGSFRFLRVLRVFSIMVRLQKLGIVDFTKTYLFVVIKKYYDVLVEEISDRVVVNVLEGIQSEIVDGGPMVDSIINEVIRPRQPLLVEWISRRVETILERDVIAREDEIVQYVNNLISESLEKNAEIKSIEQLPLMGKTITKAIENTISNTINNIISTAIADLASPNNRKLVNDATNMVLNTIEHKDEEEHLNDIFKDISIDVLEIVKRQVKVQKWKEL